MRIGRLTSAERHSEADSTCLPFEPRASAMSWMKYRNGEVYEYMIERWYGRFMEEVGVNDVVGGGQDKQMMFYVWLYRNVYERNLMDEDIECEIFECYRNWVRE